jgi:HAD superfamily hydrolase (TIGR01549 family)
MKIKFILFDAIGTVVKENAGNHSTIINCFIKAFKTKQIEVTYQEINPVRGKSKIEAIHELLLFKNQPLEFSQEIYSKFVLLLKEYISEFTEQDGATELFYFLKEKKIKIGLGSGLPDEIMRTLCQNLNWTNIFNYIGSSDRLGKGRPNPIMIFDAMEKLSISNPKLVLKVGDTVADIEEGKNAGVYTAAVLTGTQEIKILKNANPDFIFENILGIKNIV